MKMKRKEESNCRGYLRISRSRVRNLKLMGAYHIQSTDWLLFSTTMGGIILGFTLQMRQLRLREMWWPSVSPIINFSYASPATDHPEHKKSVPSPSTPPNMLVTGHPNTKPGSEAKTVQSTLLLLPSELQFSYREQCAPLVFLPSSFPTDIKITEH